MKIAPLKFKQSTKPCMYAATNIATTDAKGNRLHLLTSITGQSKQSVLNKAIYAIIKYRISNNLPV